jgi:hypothetical protein
MCRPRVGEANSLFFLCRALWRPTALAKKALGRQRNLGLTQSESPKSKKIIIIIKTIQCKGQKIKTVQSTPKIKTKMHPTCQNKTTNKTKQKKTIKKKEKKTKTNRSV